MKWLSAKAISIASAPLARIHGRVGQSDQCLRLQSMFWKHGNPDARADVHFNAFDEIGFREFVNDFLGNGAYACLVLAVGDEQQEFVATDTPDQIGLANLF